MKKSPLAYLSTIAKGMAMGAADVVPGVSGGTIAFITGIYEELVATIDRLDLGILKSWRKEGVQATFKTYNLLFLLSLFVGIAISVLSLARVIGYLLENYPILVWSFFFGLVLASILFIAKQITRRTLPVLLGLLVGTAVAYSITVITPSEAPDVWYFYFLSGFIAIIAMILPGISGSFILVLLGSYAMVLGAVTDFIDSILEQNWKLLKATIWKCMLFGLGCIAGLKFFSKALKWMFKHKKQLTLAVLTGFMIGSLNKIWPWKKVLSTRIDRHGEEVALDTKSILPSQFEGEPYLLYAIVMAVVGFGLILLLERLAKEK